MDTALASCQLALGLAAVLTLLRAIRGPSLADRIVAIDLVLLLLAGVIALHGARTGSEDYVPVLVAVALVAFAGTVLVARFIEWRDAR